MYFLKFAGHFCFLFSEMILGFFLYFLKNNLVLVVLGLRCCAWALSSRGGQGLLLVEVRCLLLVVVSLVAAPRALGARGVVVVAHVL